MEDTVWIPLTRGAEARVGDGSLQISSHARESLQSPLQPLPNVVRLARQEVPRVRLEDLGSPEVSPVATREKYSAVLRCARPCHCVRTARSPTHLSRGCDPDCTQAWSACSWLGLWGWVTEEEAACVAENLNEPGSARSFQLLGVSFFSRENSGRFQKCPKAAARNCHPNGWRGGLLIPDWLALWREARKTVGASPRLSIYPTAGSAQQAVPSLPRRPRSPGMHRNPRRDCPPRDTPDLSIYPFALDWTHFDLSNLRPQFLAVYPRRT